MPRIRGSANGGRPRARLISTPTAYHPDPTSEGIPDMTSTVAGEKFSDQLAALLDHAQAHGFRIEPNTRGKARGVMVYPPDTEHRPFTVEELRAKFNKAHYENVRRDFYKSGCPPLPTDAPATTTEEPAVPKHTHVHKSYTTEGEMASDLRGADGAHILGGIVEGLFDRADLEAFGSLAGGLAYAVAAWARDNVDFVASTALERARSSMQTEIDAALTLAADAEAKAARLEKAVTAADAATEKARADCKAALARAKAAETEAAALEAAIAPLRSLLGAGK